MQSQNVLKRHAGLVDRMATHLGIDLQEAALRGQITMSEIEDAVLRCTGCTRPGACAQMLEALAVPTGNAPDFCRNTGTFAALKT